MRLNNKVILITGGATGLSGEINGIGGAAARICAKEGAKVLIGDINDEMGQKTANQINEIGGHARYLHLDVTDEDEWVSVYKSIASVEGKLDILVNNAGTGVPNYDPSLTSARNSEEALMVEHITVDGLQSQLKVHAQGVLLGMKHGIPLMRNGLGGSIINVSSIHGIVGTHTVTSYQAAKGAVRQLTKAAAVQYSKENIRVNSIHPGFTKTPLTTELFTNPEILSDRVSQIPLGRFADAEEIAMGILFLASDESSYVTGAELIIDGGVIAQ
ncbi:MAG: NAD(P)-dependent dehydrogenase, short-chain alcohol dehydrogenase family [Chloroflexi bacterium]|jgi:NAD(P)-dependent dehydrogenase (short-subunit alcohol dehydrogenase family)|nr:MAG: NAD(P)-dependent dehydrogenase, short-chain alcohol dehydrogenase family [Chloroflexota bacterium]